MRTLRHRESKKIAQIHTASESQSLPLNLDFLPLNLCQLHYTSMKSLGQHMKSEGIVPKITFTPDINWKFERGSPKRPQVQLTELTESPYIHQFSSVQFSCSVMSDSATPWTAACQASVSITNSRSVPKLMSLSYIHSYGLL